MTLKYKLIIEGTEKELELPKQVNLHNRFICFDVPCSYSVDHSGYSFYAKTFLHQGIITKVEYKVVEPLHIELTQYVDIDGQINLRGCGILPRHAGKKVKVVITEEEVCGINQS